MGFVLTLVYICVALLSPADLAPALAPYRIELVVVGLALLFSWPGIFDRRFLRIPQSYLLVGLFAAVTLSVALGQHWVGGGLIALGQFLPAGIVFYLVALNCQNLTRLQILASSLIVIAAVYVALGSRAYLSGDITSSLLEVIPVSDGSVTFRMQGLGFLKDPNEFAQFLVMILPFLWLRWRPGARLRNLICVIAPTLFFVWGLYLTHSRGAMVALVVILMLSLKDRVSLTTTVLAGCLAFTLLLVLNFSGGREISLQSGADRLELWGDGLSLFRQSPLFGIGFEGFKGADHGHTAHNSFVVCLAELGLLGYVFWVGLLAFTISGLNSMLRMFKSESSNAVEEGEDSETRNGENQAWDEENTDLDKWARAMRISFAGYVASAFFLSRAYTPSLYLILGMAAVVIYLASEEEEPITWQPLPKLVVFSVGLGVAAIGVVYAALRLRSVFL